MGMKFSQRLRDDFPRGWWKQKQWWRDGLEDLGIRILIMIAAVTLGHRVVRAFSAHGDPRQLKHEDQLRDAWCGGALLSGIVVSATAWVTVPFGEGLMPPVLGCLLVVWGTSNLIVCLMMTVLLIRSRISPENQGMWRLVDYVDDNEARGRPPETTQEYEAEMLKNMRLIEVPERR